MRLLLAWSFSVSYRHLDVYKRQVYYVTYKTRLRARHRAPVSYTHLDVYKRQD
ncbi:hypothetical protein [Erwinia amylovora]